MKNKHYLDSQDLGIWGREEEPQDSTVGKDGVDEEKEADVACAHPGDSGDCSTKTTWPSIKQKSFQTRTPSRAQHHTAPQSTQLGEGPRCSCPQCKATRLAQAVTPGETGVWLRQSPSTPALPHPNLAQPTASLCEAGERTRAL